MKEGKKEGGPASKQASIHQCYQDEVIEQWVDCLQRRHDMSVTLKVTVALRT